MSMSMAVNAVYNRMQIQQAQVQRPKSKGSDITQAVKGAVDSYRFCGVSEFHSMKDCAADEIDFGYAIAGLQGDDNQLPCNFYKRADYNDEDPVIIARMYPWDGSDPIVREIHVKEVDLSNADYYDTFACGIYLKEKGQIQYIGDILLPYELAEEEQQEGYWDGKVDSFAKYDVLKALDNFIKESFETGRYKQYMEFKHLQEAIEKYLPASVNKVKDHNDF